MRQNPNERCPLQEECDRSCQYRFREKDCDYYRTNSRPGYMLDDQQEGKQAGQAGTYNL